MRKKQHKKTTLAVVIMFALLITLIAELPGGSRLHGVAQAAQKNELPPQPAVMDAGTLAKNLFMGIATSDNIDKWATKIDDAIRLSYPGASSWGAWYVTAGKPAESPESRMFMDMSQYTRLVIEIKGEKGTTVYVTVKDRDDLNDGGDIKHPVRLQHDGWATYIIDLKTFSQTANINKLNTLVCFVFGTSAQTVWVRQIRYLK